MDRLFLLKVALQILLIVGALLIVVTYARRVQYNTALSERHSVFRRARFNPNQGGLAFQKYITPGEKGHQGWPLNRFRQKAHAWSSDPTLDWTPTWTEVDVPEVLRGFETDASTTIQGSEDFADLEDADLVQEAHPPSKELQSFLNDDVEDACGDDGNHGFDKQSWTWESVMAAATQEEMEFLQRWNLNYDALTSLMKLSPSQRARAMREFRPFMRPGADMTGKFICYVAMLEQGFGPGEAPLAGKTFSKEQDLLTPATHPQAHDPVLRRHIAELWSKPGSLRRKRGEGPLLPAIRRERVDKAFPSQADFEELGRETYLEQGFALLSFLKEWKRPRFGVNDERMHAWLNVAGAHTTERAEDKALADEAIEDLEVALGTMAYQVLSEVQDSTVISFSTLNGPTHLTDTVPQRIPYVIQEDANIEGICIRHGCHRIFNYNECESRMHAIRKRIHESQMHRAAEVFVDAVALDLEVERAKHEGLSRRVLVLWANRLSSTHLALAEMRQYRSNDFEAKVRSQKIRRAHDLDGKVWLAVARVLNGARQDILKDDDI